MIKIVQETTSHHDRANDKNSPGTTSYPGRANDINGPGNYISPWQS